MKYYLFKVEKGLREKIILKSLKKVRSIQLQKTGKLLPLFIGINN